VCLVVIIIELWVLQIIEFWQPTAEIDVVPDLAGDVVVNKDKDD
jgi:hypothetical protein